MGGLVFAFLRPHAGRHSAFGVNAWQFNYSDGHGEHGQQSTPPTALPGRKKAHVHGIELVPAFGAGYLEQQQGNVNGYSRASRLTVAFVSSALTNRDHGRSYYDLRLVGRPAEDQQGPRKIQTERATTSTSSERCIGSSYRMN
ncbi:hypothetical protein PC122_g6530 [Phytophthora cactorum]|nr:hypothetical protein PC122_g6530 [Phytophthora cactorum]